MTQAFYPPGTSPGPLFCWPCDPKGKLQNYIWDNWYSPRSTHQRFDTQAFEADDYCPSSAQAGFRPDEVISYPALLLEPFVRAQVQYRYERGPLQTIEDAFKPLLRKINAWFGKLKLVVYFILGLITCTLIKWLFPILKLLNTPFRGTDDMRFNIRNTQEHGLHYLAYLGFTVRYCSTSLS